MAPKPVFGTILTTWVPALLKVANERGVFVVGGDARSRLRDALQDVIEGGQGGVIPRTKGWYLLPRISVMNGKYGVVSGVEFPGLVPGRDVGEFAQSHEETLSAVVMLLSTDPLARRLRRCDWNECEAFFLAKADHRREHSFCCEEHRRAYDVANRDPKEMAAYMRNYRRTLARRRKAKKRAK